MRIGYAAAGMLSMVAMLSVAETTCAQNYPNKVIRMVTSEVGGGTDLAARVIAQGLSSGAGWQVIVDNRPSGVIPGEIVAKATPDGHTLLYIGGPFWIVPLLQTTPYNPARDFSPITWVASTPNLLVVQPSLPAKSVKELIDLARAKPGDLRYASGGSGSTPHLAAELFKAMAELRMVHVPYKGAGPALTSLIGGETQLMFPTAAAGAPHVKSGRLRALAVTSAQRSALAPGLPTVAASGLPGFESVSISGVFAPAGTPRALVNRINKEIVAVVNSAAVSERLFNAGLDVVGSTPEEFAAKGKSEVAKWNKVIKKAGIRTDN